MRTLAAALVVLLAGCSNPPAVVTELATRETPDAQPQPVDMARAVDILNTLKGQLFTELQDGTGHLADGYHCMLSDVFVDECGRATCQVSSLRCPALFEPSFWPFVLVRVPPEELRPYRVVSIRIETLGDAGDVYRRIVGSEHPHLRGKLSRAYEQRIHPPR